MKKVLIIIFYSLLCIQSGVLYAYSPSQKLESKLTIAAQKIHASLESKGEKYRKQFLTILDIYSLQYEGDPRALYILNYLSEYLINNNYTCIVFDDFTTSSQNSWEIINDGVMGGLSQGSTKVQKDILIFSGNINTNGGGFSSIRANLPKNILKDTSHIRLLLKTDTRKYKITFRDSNNRNISYQQVINSISKNDFQLMTLSFSDLEASYFGRYINTTPFEKDKATQIGFILSDGIDGPFQLEIDSIEFCKKRAK